MLYFLEKAEKLLHPALASGSWGSASRPQVVIPTQFMGNFWALLKFLGIVKITTYYLTV